VHRRIIFLLTPPPFLVKNFFLREAGLNEPKTLISLLSDRLRASVNLHRERQQKDTLNYTANFWNSRMQESSHLHFGIFAIRKTSSLTSICRSALPRMTTAAYRKTIGSVSLPLCGCRQVRIKKARSSVRAVPSHASRGACCHCQYRNHAMITHTRGRTRDPHRIDPFRRAHRAEYIKGLSKVYRRRRCRRCDRSMTMIESRFHA